MRHNRRREVGFMQPGDGVAEGADARQYHFVRLGDAVGVARDDGRMTDLLERLLYAAQVGHAVIDDHDVVHVAPPPAFFS